jgi:hypothetical protein
MKVSDTLSYAYIYKLTWHLSSRRSNYEDNYLLICDAM